MPRISGLIASPSSPGSTDTLIAFSSSASVVGGTVDGALLATVASVPASSGPVPRSNDGVSEPLHAGDDDRGEQPAPSHAANISGHARGSASRRTVLSGWLMKSAHRAKATARNTVLRVSQAMST